MIETPRLLIRPFVPSDSLGVFELDSDPRVMKYLGGKTMTSYTQAKEQIGYILQQYRENGIGRWAMEEKQTGAFVGWTGFKLIKDTICGRSHFYDLGYRLQTQFWGKGYATESARASLDYGFTNLPTTEIYAMADCEHRVSNHILRKLGLQQIDTFAYDGVPHYFYHITQSTWSGLNH